jgi:signal transduction histidine kinase
MRNWEKKSLIITALLGIFFFCLHSQADSRSLNELESRLTGSSGPDRIEILVGLTREYAEIDPKRALIYGKEARELLRETPDNPLHVRLLNTLSYINMKSGDYDPAETLAKEGLEMALDRDDSVGYAGALLQLGSLAFYRGNYSRAIELLNKSRELFDEAGDAMGVGRNFNFLGLVYSKMNDYVNALEYFIEAEKIYEILGNKRGLAIVHNNCGIVHLEMGNIEKAREEYERTLEISRELNYKKGLALAFVNLASLYDNQGKNKEALDLYEKSLRIYMELGDKEGIALLQNNIGWIYEKMGEYPRALAYYTNSLKTYDSIGMPEGAVRVLSNFASVNRKLRKFQEARRYIDRAIALASELDTKVLLMDSYQTLSQILEDQEDYPDALKFYKKYKDLNDLIFNEDSVKKVTEMQARFDVEIKENQIKLLEKDRANQQNINNFMFVVFILVTILAFVIYTRYRLKIKVSRALQKEIDQRKRTEAELLKSRKLEAVGILAGGMAHDFNNLLAVIMGSISLVKDEISDNALHAQMLNRAEKASMQAADLGKKLITFSGGGWISPQEVTLASIFNGVAGEHPDLKPLLRDVVFPREVKPVYVDEQKMRQVVYNLLKNADESMPESKQLTIEANNVVVPDENDFSLKTGEYVKVSIIDKGRGILPEHLENVFDPYFSTKGTVSQKGLGLGLAICYSIVKKHNGHILVESEVGQGTTVTLYLPAFRVQPVETAEMG